MCAIAGIFDAKQPPQMAELKPMVNIQRHRGPDADGFLVRGPIAMGMRRLSIIDLKSGDQPIFNEDSSLVVVFNGEIYNYLELRKPLVRNKHRFSTKTDTEVLVHLYEEHGPGMLEKLNGMFALALWNDRTKTLLLARDRLGVKPLYYARIGSRWLFASELKALLTHKGVDTAFDMDAITDYLRLGYVPRDATPYRGVRRVLPGHYLLVQEDRFELRAWWKLSDAWSGDPPEAPEALAQELAERFDDAVRLRMRSDVPVASFLSGGLDSSLVTITAQRTTHTPINTFSLGFEHSEFDETPYARAVAKHASTAHKELIAGTRDAIRHLPLLLWHMDEPMGDSSIVPNYLISRFAARHVKVCLSGLGGDELFGGYPRYLDAGMGRIRRSFCFAPLMARSLAPLIDFWSYPWADELRLAGDPAQAWRGYLHRLEIFNRQALRRLGIRARGRAEEIVESLWNGYPGTDPVSRRQFVDQHTYLPDQILALTDRMSMANSLEVRTPFVDFRLVHFSQSVPGFLKQTARDYKIILKRSIGDRCPPALLNRPKWGFDTPLSRWVSQPEILSLAPALTSGVMVKEGLLRPAAVRALMENAATASRFSRQIWALLALETWMRVQGRQSPPAETTGELLGLRV